MTPRFSRLFYGLALAAGVIPLWMGNHLPLVDLPQHLHLISVLHRLDDPTTLYPSVFALRGNLTPYLGYYYAVHLLNWLVPLETANRLFLSAYVIGMPLSLGFLLRSLNRPRWPSVLALPFAYGDSFAWGFLNYCSALPLVFLSCGLFVRAIADEPRRFRWSAAQAVVLIAVLLFHVQAFAFLGLALPLLLLTTTPPATQTQGFRHWLRVRGPALLSVLPGVALFLIWVVGRVGEPAEIEVGVPWKAWGPMLSPQNLSFKSFEQNRTELFSVLANVLRDGSDRWALYGVALVAAAAWGLALVDRRPGLGSPASRLRMLALAAVSLVLFFALPFDIRGYIYYLNTRYAHLAAPLALAAVPPVAVRFRGWLIAAGACCAGLLGASLSTGFVAFDREVAPLAELVALTSPEPRVMALIFNTGSAVVSHPVFLHSGAVLARERGGLTNFSFALTPHSPIRYRGEPPPTFASEWRPDQFRYDRQGAAYDHFLLRGVAPDRVFGPLLDQELAVVGHVADFWLVRRRSAPSRAQTP